MELRTVAGRGGLDRVTLSSRDGARAEVYLQGAHVTSWRPATDDRERLFLSERSEYCPGGAIRGGIPVIFPQFAAEGPLPRHGFARTSRWSLGPTSRNEDGDAVASFELTDTADTRAIWAAAFRAVVTVQVGTAHLAVSLSVENTGADTLTFTSALHTYLRVHDLNAVELVGLHGCRYRAAHGGLDFEDRERIRITGEVDRVYVDAPTLLTLREPGSTTEIETTTFPDVVVWNPGAARAAELPDMETGGERHMVCVEAAVVQTPVVLDAGRSWRGTQTLFAYPPTAGTQ